MRIDIVSLLLVAGASIIGAAIFVSLCALGLRLLVAPGDGPSSPRPLGATIGAYTCFALCGLCVVVAVYLIVPVWQL